MIDFLKKLKKTACERGTTVAVLDQDGKRSTTYAQLNDCSSRVASYLREKGIGREDVVAILLPRSMEYFATELAVLKVGAAFTPLDSHQASSRREYILKDCRAKLVLTMTEYLEALTREPLQEWADSASHDLAFIIYTSGSTGNPKGVMQEYGTIDLITKMTEGNLNFGRYRDANLGAFRIALVNPLIFVATVIMEVICFWQEGTFCIISETLLQDFKGLLRYFIDYDVHATFMTMSLYKRVPRDIELPLKIALVGSEPVSGVASGAFKLANVYSMSELALCLIFIIGQPYKITPVGRPDPFLEVRLIDVRRQQLAQKEGILCVYQPYFRGYLNLPEKTAASFIKLEGKKYFITDDWARIDEAQCVTILGRADDMIKINGNRVEPGEVEGAILRAFPEVKQAAVRGFTDRHGLNYLCAYYLAPAEIELQQFRTRLRKEITAYMFPRYYIHLQSFPLTTTGKVARRELPEPLAEQYKAAYVAPGDELEQALCEGFAKVLQIDQISVEDDFYLLGGDSLGTMTLVAQLPIEGITFQEILKGRTPREIAKLCRERNMVLRKENAGAVKVRHSDYPLRVVQRGYLDMQLMHAKSTSLNLGGLYKVDPAIDFDRLVPILRETIASHDALGIQIFIDEETLELRQRFMKERLPLEIEEVSEAAFEEIKKSLKRPFQLFNHFLYRLRAFRTPAGAYLFIDLHHLIIDGTSAQLLFRNIDARYRGKALKKENYDFQDVLEQEFYAPPSGHRAASKGLDLKSFLAKVDVRQYVLDADYEGKARKGAEGEVHFSVPDLNKNFFRGKKYTPNVFFLTAALISQARYLGKEEAFLVWTSNGRNSRVRMRTVGPILLDTPIYVDFKGGLTVDEILEQVESTVLRRMQGTSSADDVYDTAIVNSMGFLYQQELFSNPLIDGKALLPQDIPDPFSATVDLFNIEIWARPPYYHLCLCYDAGLYEQQKIEDFCQIYLQTITRLAAATDIPVQALLTEQS